MYTNLPRHAAFNTLRYKLLCGAKLSASFVSLPIRNASIHHSQKRGKAGRRVGKYVHTPTKKKKKKSTNTCNHITANAFHIWPTRTQRPNRKKKIQQQHLFQLESTYAHPQKSAHPESTEWSYEHFISEHKHFIPTAHVITRPWSWRTAGIMGSGLAPAISIFPFAGSQAMLLLEHGDITTSAV